MARNTCRAVAAGLVGLSALATPSSALAVSPSDVIGVVLSSPVAALACGFAGGVLVSGAVAIVALHGRSRGDSAADSAAEPPLTSADGGAPDGVPATVPVAPVTGAEPMAEEAPARAPRHLARPGEPARYLMTIRPDEDEPLQAAFPAQAGVPAPDARAGEGPDADVASDADASQVLVIGPRDDVMRTVAALAAAARAADEGAVADAADAAGAEPVTAEEPVADPAPAVEPVTAENPVADASPAAGKNPAHRAAHAAAATPVEPAASDAAPADAAAEEPTAVHVTVVEAPAPVPVTFEEAQIGPAASVAALEEDAPEAAAATSEPAAPVTPVAPAAQTPAVPARAASRRRHAAPEPAPGAGGRHVASDYEDIAESYVRKLSFRERMARQAAGVAAALTARIEASQMSDVPQIERAQGTGLEPGADLWAQAVAVDEHLDDAWALAQEARPAALSPAAQATAAATPAPSSAATPAAPAPRDRAAGLAAVPFVEEPAAEAPDLWDQALRGMDDLSADEPALVAVEFVDLIGPSDTLDEPDNLEPDTQFIPFRRPAGHPEVVDTDSYVDYLVAEEFSRNSSRAARHSSRRYLRVLEGGTSSQPPVGRHFRLAAEA